MGKVLARKKRDLCEAYMAGNPAPEATRIAVAMVEQWVEQFFNAEAEQIEAELEEDDE